MRGRGIWRLAAWLIVLHVLLLAPVALAGDLSAMFDDNSGQAIENGGQEDVSDPLEPVNRAFFTFNDKLYSWVMKPVATAYATVVADDVRMCVRNFFSNLLAPVRIVNNILQGKFSNAGVEVARVLINSTVGAAGFGDPAASEFKLKPREEDLGQTLAVYGIGNGVYFCWPFLGPSTLRDTIGMIGDGFISPINYMNGGFRDTAAAQSGAKVNDVSLRLGEYEDFKAAALDPYVSLRDAYYQYRRAKVGDREKEKPALTENSGPVLKDAEDTSPKGIKLTAPDTSSDRCFSVHVGMCLDEAQAAAMAGRLKEMSMEAVVKVHDRGDYRFYGVETPVAGTFAEAKETEMILAAQGFASAMVVNR